MGWGREVGFLFAQTRKGESGAAGETEEKGAAGAKGEGKVRNHNQRLLRKQPSLPEVKQSVLIICS